jgi:glycosyltransferase involved in cell wall biosynthesis
VAAYDYRKGYDVLADAFKMVRAERPDIRLKIAGTGTDSRVARKLFPMDGVELLGHQDKSKIRELLYESHALVLPSRSEVQPLVVLEAMSTGIPVVATTSVPQNERLEGACSIVATDDADALAQAMLETVAHYNQYDGEAIARQTRALASPEVVGKKLTELFAQAKG